MAFERMSILHRAILLDNALGTAFLQDESLYY
jgi:hypothetical protein